jgi:DNA end-binding protein Ku
MAATIWNGRITFGLVSVPVKLFRAVEAHDIHFNLLHAPDKSRIKLQYYCPNDDEVVERSELVHGYEYEKGKYVIIEDEEIEQIAPQSSSSLDIEEFIDLKEVDPIYFERTYYVGPSEAGTEKTFALLAKAMEKKGRAGVGKMFMRDHEYLALVRPAMGGLVLELLNYEDEIRKNEFTVSEKDVRQKELELAELLIENLTGEWQPEQYKNEYIERLQELIEAKVEGRKLTVHRTKPKPVVTDLMKALEQSLRQTGGKKPQARASHGSEVDLPIENYDQLSVSEILEQIDELSAADRRKIADYETKHKKRKSLLGKLRRAA